MFESLIKLHYSQTKGLNIFIPPLFESLIKLHYSQTPFGHWFCGLCLSPLLNYTTLKRTLFISEEPTSLSPLLNYTTLKLEEVETRRKKRFESLIKLHYSQT